MAFAVTKGVRVEQIFSRQVHLTLIKLGCCHIGIFLTYGKYEIASRQN